MTTKKEIEITEKLKEKLREIKQEAWNSDRNAAPYIQGYYWGLYWTVIKIEEIVGKIDIDYSHIQGSYRNR